MGLNLSRVVMLAMALLFAGWYGASGVIYAQAVVSAIVGSASGLWGWRYLNWLGRQALPAVDVAPARPYAHADRFRRR